MNNTINTTQLFKQIKRVGALHNVRKGRHANTVVAEQEIKIARLAKQLKFLENYDETNQNTIAA